jgi:hypothetical protein
VDAALTTRGAANRQLTGAANVDHPRAPIWALLATGSNYLCDHSTPAGASVQRGTDLVLIPNAHTFVGTDWGVGSSDSFGGVSSVALR